jgi:streptomycin 6-kinase
LAARPDTRELLSALHRIGEKCGPAVPSSVDFTHFDLHFLNLLSGGQVIAGVIDVNPPPLRGDRAFDLATLVFSVYDHDELRRPILARPSSATSGEPGRDHYVLR